MFDALLPHRQQEESEEDEEAAAFGSYRPHGQSLRSSDCQHLQQYYSNPAGGTGVTFSAWGANTAGVKCSQSRAAATTEVGQSTRCKETPLIQAAAKFM